jgi:hypothetical protein
MVKVVKALAEMSVKPKANGGVVQRMAHSLKKLNYVKVLKPECSWQVLSGVALLYRHLFIDLDPQDILVQVLAGYILWRLTRGESVGLAQGRANLQRLQDLYEVQNPFTGKSLGCVCAELNLHPVFKDEGDPFADKLRQWWLAHTERPLQVQQQRAMLLTALFILSVRSYPALEWFLAHPDVLLTDIDVFTCMWKAICATTGPFVALRPGRPHSLHTTEQKTIGAGKLLDDLVHRLWLEPERLDAVLVARTPVKLVAALKSLPRMKGVLGSEHTLDYFILCEKDAGHHLFQVPLTKRTVDWAIVGGNNSQVFLKIWNASSQRGSARDQTWTSLAAQLSRILPRSIELEQGQVVQCPRFTALDCVQTTCKFVEVLQTLLSGKTGGKERPGK